MHKIKVKGSIKNAEIENLSSQEVEDRLESDISESILAGVKEQLSNFSFIDIDQNIEEKQFDWKADIIICSANQVSTSMAMVVQNLTARGIKPEEIGLILEPLSNDMKGW